MAAGKGNPQAACIRMIGTELAARFALPPNSLSYCGTPLFRNVFASYLDNKSAADRMRLEKALEKFTAHYAYLRLIAAANRLSPFDEKVTEALWLGNRLLEEVRMEDVAGLIERGFSGQGMLSQSRAHKLADSMPEGFVPHHSFHVLYLHTISGVIAPSVKNADSCRVSWGNVTEAGDGFVNAKSQKLLEKNGKLALLSCKKRLDTSCAGIELVQGLEKGDLVASHWGVAVMRISSQQAKRLEKYTEMNIAAANLERG